MSNVDKRVVEMQFDNKQFEKDMSTTVKSLKDFEKSLELKNGSKSLKDFEKQLKTTEQKANDVKFDRLVSSIEGINKRLSLLGTIAFSTVQKITQDSIDKIVGGINKVYDTVMVKGEQRALNLEQANFKLMGLLKNEKEVAKVMEDVDYAVSGTAYGLDAAAGVAAQLAASQIKAGDEMKTALRGISGVAAMTSSSYEDIGQVFTRVAGQGKVMATDLNSLAARGLNAAAELAKYLGVTEADIRKMTRKGQIDFKTFATAMNQAFGEQSKKANETFTGAMSNVQAALGRIGAGFKQPYIKYMRPVLVQLIDNINSVKDALGPLYDTASFLFERLSHFALTVLQPLVGIRKEGGKQIKTIGFLRDIFLNIQELITTNWERIARLINTVTHLFWKFLDMLKPVADMLAYILKDLFGELMGLSWSLKDTYRKGNLLWNMMDNIKDVLVIVYHWVVKAWPGIRKILTSVFSLVGSIFRLISTIIKPIQEVILDIISFEDIINVISEIISAVIDTIKAVIDAVTEAVGEGDLLHAVLSAIASVLKIGIKIIEKVLSYVGKAIRFLTPFIKTLVTIASKIGTIISNLIKLGINKVKDGIKALIQKFTDLEGPLGRVAQWFVNAKKWLVDKFTSYTKSASDALDWLTNKLTFTGKSFDKSGDSAEESGNKITTFKKKVKETTSSLTESIKSNNIIQTIWEKVKNFFGFIWNGIKGFIEKIKTNFSKSFEGFSPKGNITSVFDWIKNGFKSLGELAANLIKSLGPVRDAILKFTGTNSIMDLIQRIVSLFVSFQMGKFFKSFGNFHDALANLPNTISDFIKTIKKPFDEINKNFEKKPSSALKNFALSMLMLSASLFIISKIPYKRLQNSMKNMGIIIAMMLGSVILVSKALSKTTAAYRNILAFSLVIYAFQKTVRSMMLSFMALMLVVDKVKASSVVLSVLVITTIGGMIGAFGILFAKFAKLKMNSSQILAYSLLIKTFGSVIKELAIMIAILSLPMFDPGKMAIASGCIAGITAIIGALLALFISKGSRYGSSPSQVAAFALLIKTFGSVIKELAIMIAILSLPIFDPGKLWNSVAIVTVIGLVIGGLIATMKLVQNNKASQIAAFALFIKVISGALRGIIILIGILTFFNPGKVWGCVGVVAAIAAVIAGLATLSSKVGGDGLYKVGKGIMFIGVGILALATAIKTLGKLSPEAIVRITDVITAIVSKAPEWLGIIIAGLIKSLISFVPLLAETFVNFIVMAIQTMTKSAGVIVTAIMNFFKVLVQALASFSNAFDIKDLFWAINAVALIAGLIYVLQVIASDMKSALKGIALMAIVLGAIVGALVIINNFTDPEKSIEILKGISSTILSLAGIFAAIGLISAVMTMITGGNATETLKMLGTVILGFMIFIIGLVASFMVIGGIINAIGKDALEAINRAVNVIGLIGKSLGQFMGNIVKSFAELIKDSDTSISMLLTMVPLILALEPLTLALPVLTAFLIAIGALMKALDDNFGGAGTAFLEKATEVLPLIGDAIGGFLGSLVGSALRFASQGIADSLLAFADVLSSLFDRLDPFLKGLKSISKDTLESATVLTGILLEMCAVELASAIVNFLSIFTGGYSIVKLAEDLADMGPYLVEFSNCLRKGKFNSALANSAANCSLTMAKALSSLPRDNGFWDFIAGKRISMDKFGEEAEGLAQAMAKFSDSVSGISKEKAEKVKILLPIIESLVGIAKAMPREGGLFQKLIGELKSLDQFGTELSDLGKSLTDFAKSCDTISNDQAEKIKKLIPIVGDMKDLANEMPRENGFWQKLIGNVKGLDQFGDELATLGVGLDALAKNVGHINDNQMKNLENIIPRIQDLKDLANEMVKEGLDISVFGIFSFKEGDKKGLDDFGNELGALGEGISEFAANTADISQNNVTSATGAINLLKMLSTINTEIKSSNSDPFNELVDWITKSNLDGFASKLPSIGKFLKSFAKNTADMPDMENTSKAAEAVKNIVTAFSAASDIEEDADFSKFFNVISNFMGSDQTKNGVLGKFINLFGKDNEAVEKTFKRMNRVSDIIKSIADAFSHIKDLSFKDDVDTHYEDVVDIFIKAMQKFVESGKPLLIQLLTMNKDFDIKQAVDNSVHLKDIINNLIDAFDAMTRVSSSKVKEFGECCAYLYDPMENFNQIAGYYGPSTLPAITKLFGDNPQSAKSDMEAVSSSLTEMAKALSNISSKTFNKDKVKQFGESLGELDTSEDSPLYNLIKQGSPFINNSLTVAANNLVNFADGLSDLTNVDADAAENLKDSVNSLGEMSITSIIEDFDKRSKDVITKASNLIKNVGVAYANQKNFVVNQVRAIMNATTKELNSYTLVSTKDPGSFYVAGLQSVNGYVKGIADNLYKAVEAGRKIGRSALQGTQFALDEHSPSKEYGKLAGYSIDGYVQEIMNRLTEVRAAGEKFGTESIRGTRNTISNLAAVINQEMDSVRNPVITPVLDFSELSNQSRRYGDILNSSGYSYQLAGRTLTLIDQNDANRARAKINQNRSPDVVEAINNLTSRMDSLEQTIVNRPIVMDGEKVTKQIAPSMDRALGRRKYYSGRGN